MLQSALTALGYAVVTASNGQEAVAAFQVSRYDAVLMDCQMPIMDGLEATLLIRALENGSRRTPIIGYTCLCNRDECLAAGMDSHVQKSASLDPVKNELLRWAPLGS
jgi:CheY-like chemotaxis protein